MFWRVLRDDPVELARRCALTPHSRAEYSAAYGDLSDLPDLERARRVWVRLSQGRSGTLRKTGWRHYVDARSSSTSMPGYLVGYVERIHPVAARLALVSLESRPALDLIDAYGRHRSTLLYVDPPYPGETRMRNYRHEMTDPDQHRALAKALRACSATVVVSGYASDLYDSDLYASWHRHTLASGTSQGGTWETRCEVLWSNRPLHTEQAPLFTGNETCPTEAPTTLPCNETRCEEPDCGLSIRQPATGRRRRFCSTACRVARHRSTHSSPTS
ncbi:DNA adenine methylase [Phytomonospora sp. NPDC050363]|uniref:DNA adenine methylase n=1 Tax=Phytomonospora sp. NPDC050363 TaxID=3155642 RepID=UPI0033FCDE88